MVASFQIFDADAYLDEDRLRTENESRYFLSDYVSSDKKIIVVDKKEFEVRLFQGKHSNEYLVSELKDGKVEGRCQLFNKGILSMAWTVNNGKRTGYYSTFEKGKAVRKENWNSFFGRHERRIIENHKNGLLMTVHHISDNGEIVTYRGEFDDDLNRNGKGVEYDKDTGKEKLEGYWVKDKLVRIVREFEDTNEMIEYAEYRPESFLSRVPVYYGGYCVEDYSFLRNGVGYTIDESSGAAIRESVWDHGVEIEGADLYDGWYVKESSDSIRSVIHKNEVNEPSNEEENENVIEELTIDNEDDFNNVFSSTMCVENLIITSVVCKDINAIDFNQLKSLKVLEIGDECFRNVNKFSIVGLNRLRSLKIGKNSFTKNKNWYGEFTDNTFSIVNCYALQSIEIGEYSFSDYAGLFELKNLPALNTLQIGTLNQWSNNFYRASLMIRGILLSFQSTIDLENLKAISVGDFAFCETLHVTLAGMSFPYIFQYQIYLNLQLSTWVTLLWLGEWSIITVH